MKFQFFKTGDFYEVFDDQAKELADIMGLVVTSRKGRPMCGIPIHASSDYFAELTVAGHAVEIKPVLQ